VLDKFLELGHHGLHQLLDRVRHLEGLRAFRLCYRTTRSTGVVPDP
jgi:hypothetical protein